MTTPPWPAEQQARLLKLIAQGATRVGDIADAMGLSRSAVIGKIQRLKAQGVAIETHWVGQTDKRIIHKHSHRPRMAPIMPKAKGAQPVHLPLGRPPQPEPLSPEVTIEMRRLTLLQLGHRHCKWPIGDPGTPEFHFCGNNTATGHAYCLVHHRVAHGRK